MVLRVRGRGVIRIHVIIGVAGGHLPMKSKRINQNYSMKKVNLTEK